MVDLPAEGRITAIEPQKRRKNRLAIFIDNVFAFGVDADVAAKFNLQVDRILDQTTIQAILDEEEYRRALERAYRFLAARARSEQELRNRLRDYRYPPYIIERVVVRCRELGYIDDSAFALQYAAGRLQSRPMARWLLVRELIERGVSENLAERAARRAFEAVDERHLAQTLAEKKWRVLRKQSPQKAKQKLTQFLRSRGFDWEIIQEVLQSIG